MAKRIAVIGTGISGASCATRLSQQLECSVKLFEKSRGAGGRMATRRDCTSEGVAVQCDHGAQYFTARSAPFQSQVQEWSKAGVVARWSALPKVYNSEKSTWEDSTSDIGRWCGTPTMNAPVKNMLQNEDVVLNSTVCAIAKTATGEWSLCLEESGWSKDKFDAVVCAVPAPQALVLVEPHSSTLAGVASSTTMKGAWALMLQYPTPLDLPFDSAFINGGPLSWIARDSSKPGRDSGVDTWLVHATAAWSHDNIEKSSEEVATTLLDALCSLKVPPGTKQVNLPHTWTAHRWRYATTHPNLNIHSVWDKEAKLGMCGDWLDEGKVEGAWLSGRHLADSINESLCSSGSGAPTASKL